MYNWPSSSDGKTTGIFKLDIWPQNNYINKPVDATFVTHVYHKIHNQPQNKYTNKPVGATFVMCLSQDSLPIPK